MAPPRREPLLDAVRNDTLHFTDHSHIPLPHSVAWTISRKKEDRPRPLSLFSLIDETRGWRTSLGEPKCLVEAMLADLCRV